MNQTGVFTALFEDLLYPYIFAGATLTHEFDLDARLSCKLLGVLSHLVTQRLSEARVVENSNVLRVQIRGHPVGVAQARQRASDDDAVPA